MSTILQNVFGQSRKTHISQTQKAFSTMLEKLN